MTDRPTAYQSEPRDLTWLRPDPSNPNVHPPESIAAIAASIHAFGFDQPILATRDGRIIAGHGRFRPLAGMSVFPGHCQCGSVPQRTPRRFQTPCGDVGVSGSI